MTQQPVAPHPVAALLTPEMKARVRAEPFVNTANGIRSARDRNCCPLAIAVEAKDSLVSTIRDKFGVREGSQAYRDIRDFILQADWSRTLSPADIYILLGCEPTAPAARDEEGGR